MRLVIVHNHYRPGGVRRVIELATPHLVAAMRPRITSVVLAGGEAPDESWASRFGALTAPASVVCLTERALSYLGEQRAGRDVIIRRLRRFFGQLFAPGNAEESIVWAHNQGLGRNLLLTRELQRVCAAQSILLVSHHHDWWFDNRWQRWSEMRKSGFRGLGEVAQCVFSGDRNLRHVGINQADSDKLKRYFGERAAWLPNPGEAKRGPSRSRMRTARQWLARKVGNDAPVWILPCRLLRRKNVAEAALLTRWLRPEAWLVTTGGVSSAEEAPYAALLEDAARRGGWHLRLRVLAGAEAAAPSVRELLAASEAVLFTSLMEGFGLPYLEASEAGRPLIARALPNVMPDLAHLGFCFPQAYEELLVDPALFNLRAEVKRQETLYRAWRSRLPCECRGLAREPWLLLSGALPIPFSRLTLAAQLEVLTVPVERSWEACVPLNPFLRAWRELAQAGRLRVSRWPSAASQFLSGTAYARRWCRIVRQRSMRPVPKGAGFALQQEFIEEKLATANLYPLSWG